MPMPREQLRPGPRYIPPNTPSRPRRLRDWQISVTQIIVLVIGAVFAGIFGPHLL